MDIDFKEALEKAKENKDIERSREEGYFLNSGTVIFKPEPQGFDRWIITFYSTKEEEVVQAIVKKDGEVEFKESEKAIDPTTEELDLDKVEITAEEAIEKAKKEREEEQGEEGRIKQIILSIKKEEGEETWETNLITSSFSLFQAKINAETGEITHASEESLIKGEGDLPFPQ